MSVTTPMDEHNMSDESNHNTTITLSIKQFDAISNKLVNNSVNNIYVDESCLPNKGVHNTSDAEIVETYPVVIMDDTFNELKLASITKEYFKKLVHRAKYSLKQKANLA